MKSEFALAFNQICAEYSLPRDVVLDAVQAALVTAYRRDWKIATTQNITAEISLDTGLARIYLEKVIVDAVEDPTTEISLKDARKRKSKAEVDEVLMVDVTPKNFGRIAAQTAKQVITQRLREAERESQFNRFSRQEHEIIIGTIQSVTPHGVTLHLERTEEAHMPKREQIPGERYTIHQKIRVYVLEVKRTPRGPEIVVSRSHPLMLRRLLELEVPEIRNGQVEIKAIAREAGTRAKIAVIARQPGLDPIGACVGMRGIRIQTISRELHGERIDVVEWAPAEAQFIGNALSMSKILSVTLDPHNPGGRTASVVVLDEQLSLAIGRSGQNARLTAKLTNWRVDIQGATEAALWTLEQVNKNPDLLDEVKGAATFIPRLAGIMRTHEKDRYPYTDEELHVIETAVQAVRQALIARRDAERPALRQARARRSAQEQVEARRLKAKREAKARVPQQAYDQNMHSLDLSEKILSNLLRNGLTSVGEVMERIAQGDEALLILDGVGVKALQEIKQAVEQSDLHFVELQPDAEAEEVVEAEPASADPTVLEAVEETEQAVEEIQAVAELTAQDAEVEAAEAVELDTEEEAREITEPESSAPEPEPGVEAITEAEAEAGIEAEAEEEVEIVEVHDAQTEEEEDAQSIEEIFKADIFSVPVEDYETVEDEEEFEQEDTSKKQRNRKKRRTVLYDEERDETFVVRKRRRHKDVWDEYGDGF